MNLIVAILLAFPFLLIVFDSFFRAIYLGVAGFSRPQTGQVLKPKISEMPILILVLAHNEQPILARTLKLIQSRIDGDSSVTLGLLADNCTDGTVKVAERSGAIVFVRSDGISGKGRALSWFATNFQQVLDAHEIIVILDADTMLAEGFCFNIRSVFSLEDIQVVQSFVEPVNADGAVLATLASFSEILSQSIDDKARSCLGWISPLRGTGMAFRSNTFLRVCPGLQTQVDDIELSLRLSELNILIKHIPFVRIFDPKSSSILGLAKQRGRWLKGQREIWKVWRKKFGRPSRFSELSLIHGLLLKPKIALLAIKVALLTIFAYLGGIFIFPRLLVILCLCVDSVYYLVGLRHVSNPQTYIRSFISAPGFFVMWIVGWFYSLSRNSRWLRTRK